MVDNSYLEGFMTAKRGGSLHKSLVKGYAKADTGKTDEAVPKSSHSMAIPKFFVSKKGHSKERHSKKRHTRGDRE